MLSKVEMVLADTAANAVGRVMAVDAIAREAATRRLFIVIWLCGGGGGRDVPGGEIFWLLGKIVWRGRKPG